MPEPTTEPSEKPAKPAKTAPEPPPLLVWNTHRGVRQAVHSEPAGIDAAGQQRHNLTTAKLLPGLNLVPGDIAAKVAAGIETIDGVMLLERGLDGLQLTVAKQAIAGTGNEAVLNALVGKSKSDKVLEAIAAQLARLAREGATGTQARSIQLSHSRRV